MMPGEAEKMAGRLAWGSAYAFRQYGRAMLRPIYDQQSRRDGKIAFELRAALEWWRVMLTKGIAEFHDWEAPTGQPVHLFADARGSPAHVGAVLVVDGACYWTHSRVPRHLMSRFRRREDQQIMGLELLGIALGLTTFAPRLKQRKLVIHCDNTGAEVREPLPHSACARSCVVQVAVRKGTARAHDHAQLCHEQWLQLADLKAHAWVVRVATDDNVADLPSREVCCMS